MIKLPGRIYEVLNERAQVKCTFNIDLDVCDALSRPRIKKRGAGFSAYLDLTAYQIRRLASWIKDDDTKRLREYRDALLKAANTTEEYIKATKS